MIARLSPGRSQETASLWSAYGWSPSVGPDLLRAFKGPLLEILRNEGPEYRKLGNLRSLFMTVCLEAPEELTEQEIRGVVDALPENGLKTILRSLKRRLTGEAAERERIWREMVHPWLGKYWSQAAVRNTAGNIGGHSGIAGAVRCGVCAGGRLVAGIFAAPRRSGPLSSQ